MSHSSPSYPSYEDELHFAIQIAKRAGELIIQASQARQTGQGDTTINDKKNRIDLVTETDEAVEKLISDSIQEKFPNHQFKFNIYL